MTVTVTGLKPGQRIGATLHSEPMVITGIPVADVSGRIVFPVAIPANFPTGAHTLIVDSAGLDPISISVTVLSSGALSSTGAEVQGWLLASGMLLAIGGALLASRRSARA